MRFQAALEQRVGSKCPPYKLFYGLKKQPAPSQPTSFPFSTTPAFKRFNTFFTIFIRASTSSI